MGRLPCHFRPAKSRVFGSKPIPPPSLSRATMYRCSLPLPPSVYQHAKQQQARALLHQSTIFSVTLLCSCWWRGVFLGGNASAAWRLRRPPPQPWGRTDGLLGVTGHTAESGELSTAPPPPGLRPRPRRAHQQVALTPHLRPAHLPRAHDMLSALLAHTPPCHSSALCFIPASWLLICLSNVF